MNSRHKLRELAMTSLYQHFLLQKDIKECVYDNSETNEIDPFLYTVTIDAIRYQDVYIDKINAALRQDVCAPWLCGAGHFDDGGMRAGFGNGTEGNCH